MKNTRSYYSFQVIGMYGTQIPFYVGIVSLFSEETSDILLYSVLCGFGAMILFCLLTGILSIRTAWYVSEAPYQRTTRIKLLLIPYYLVNFAVGFVMVSGFMNPFLLLLIPLFIAFDGGITYLFMLFSGLPSLLYTVKKYRSVLRTNKKLLFAVLLHFFFCVDCIGAYLLMKICTNLPIEESK